MKSKKGETGQKNRDAVGSKSMSYECVLALVEECHRLQGKTYTRVSLEELVGNHKLIDAYAALLIRTVNSFGRRSGGRTLNALGMELVEASLRLLMLRYLPGIRACRKAMATGLEGERMKGDPAAGVVPRPS